MKYSKRYIIFSVLLIFFFVVNFYFLSVQSYTVERFRGAALKSDVWNPMIAEDVNGNVIRVVIDNKEFTSDKVDFYMNEDRNIMVPVSILRDSLNCSARIYDDTKLVIEKHSVSATMVLDSTSAVKGSDSVQIVSPMVKKNGEYYVSLGDLSTLLGYECSFDIVNNTITTADTSENVSVVPTSYDLRDRKRVSQIRNQGYYGTCWAFAAISALESSILPEAKKLFSVDNMILNNSFNVNLHDGGEYTMGMAYLAAWQGPVYEKDDVYGDNSYDPDLKAVAHVQEMQVLDGKDYEAIKQAVFKYGGVQTSLYITLGSSQIYSPYYNASENAYCYIGQENANHDVVIIGWDDNYPKKNFPTQLEGDGAFICQNSWGTGFGDNGVFYVSYYDTNIGTHNVVYTKVEDTDNYDNIYQSDLCGWVGKMGYGKEHIYGANVFTAKNDETLKAAAFYATASDTEYEVFVVKDFENADSLSKRIKVASGTFDKAGYYTVDFDENINLYKGEKYAVGVYLKTPGAINPLAVEYDSLESEFDNTVTLEDGEGYTSIDGRKFVRSESEWKCNLCIKAFSDNR